MTTLDIKAVESAIAMSHVPNNHYGSNWPISFIDIYLPMLLFDVSSIPSNATITSAKLYLYKRDENDDYSSATEIITARNINNNVSWNTVTWNTKPTLYNNTSVNFPLSDLDADSGYVEIKSLVQRWVNVVNYGIAFTTVDAPYSEFSPAEGIQNDVGKEPRLVITYNAPPTTPGTFASPTGTLKGGDTTTVSWGASSDSEGGTITYELEVSYNGGSSYTNVYTGTSRSRSYAIPTNQTQVRFRVRARDTSYAYSGYRTSNNLTISQNSAPTVTLNTTNNRTLYENDTFSIDGTTQDTDSGNVVNVKYQINSGTVRAIATQISNGSAFPFNKVLTFKQNKLYDGANAVTADLAEGTQHVLKVWAEDDQGGKSADQVRTFYVVPNRIPSIAITNFNNQPINHNDTFEIPRETDYQFNLTVNDSDASDSLSYQIKVGGVITIDFTTIENGTGQSVTIDKSSLISGMNSVDVVAKDDQGGENTVRFNLTVNENIPIDSSCLANMKFNGYSLSTISLAELVNHLE